MTDNKYLRLVIIVSLIFTLLNSAPFFYGLTHRPNDKVYLGTIHYYQDFFFYVSQFYQGARGNWLNNNLYTGENTAPSLLYLPNILLGKFFSIFGSNAQYSYNYSLIILTFIRLTLSFKLIKLLTKNSSSKAFAAFIFHLLATSFLNPITVDGTIQYVPFQLWRTYQFAFFRLGGIPHHALETIIFIILTYYFFKNYSLKTYHLFLFFILIISLSLINPLPAALFILSVFFSLFVTLSFGFLHSGDPNLHLKLKPYYFKIIPIIIGFLLSFIYLNRIHRIPPFLQVKLWEQSQQIATSIPFLLASMGPIAILAIIGIYPTIKKINPGSLFVIFLPLISYFLFLSEIPQKIGIANFRLMFNGIYIFLGILASNAVFFLSKLSDKRFHLKEQYSVICLTFLFIIISIPTLFWELNERVSISKNLNEKMVYLDRSIYLGYKKLEKLGNQNNIVLADSQTGMDTLIPALSRHKTYNGHALLTIDSEKKRIKASEFFQKKINTQDAKKFLNDNNITYVFFTALEGNAQDFNNMYPFLTSLYKNDSVTIFTNKIN